MRPKYFYIQLLAVGILFAGFNIALKHLGKNAPGRQVVRQLGGAESFNILFLGNSLVVCGIDLNAFANQNGTNHIPFKPINLALGASDTVQHLLLLRQAVAKQPRMQMCVYGFFDFQLTDDPKPEMIGNGTFSYYTEPRVAMQYYKLSWSEKQLFPLVGNIPYLMERSAVFQRVELLRRRLGAIGIPPVQNNRFGRASDFTLLEAANQSAFDTRCLQAAEHDANLTKSVQALLTLMRNHADRVVVVEMPMSLRHRQLFYDRPAWAAYRAHVRKMVTQLGAEYVQASDWISNDNYFADNLHMNAAGARDFSSILAQKLTAPLSSDSAPSR